MLTKFKYQPDFNLILDVPPEKQGYVGIGRLPLYNANNIVI